MAIFEDKFTEKKKRIFQLSVRLNEDSLSLIKSVQNDLGWSQSDVIEFALNLLSTQYSESKNVTETDGDNNAVRARH